ncbi:Arsenical resistance operon trans-acting repressor ArsD [hydrothermal vent metagenome]|uniref:Arsenical resistance operon trans-acting repressor ArsD n=1 Tax=hydrothermal vent metagenome TaxID=652676 RepID=A0A3B0SCX2_9ZZZZ
MKTLTIYDPAMCCSTGICGAEVDQTLVTFAAGLDWLKGEGVSITRINLSQEPAEFAANKLVSDVLQKTGVDGLPVILIGDELHSSGRYPARAELAELLNVTYAPDTPKSTGCCSDDSEAGKPTSGCC